MKRNNKPLSSAEHAKQLDISQEQFELQARKQVKEFFRKKGWLGPELTPSEKLELEKTAKAAHEAFEKKFPKNPDWPPFPLPDIYDNDDPELIGAAYDAIGYVLRNYIPDVGFSGIQLEKAIGVARDIRPEYPKLREIPLPNNLKWPTKQDFIRLEQWFLDAQTFVKAELCERATQGKPAEPEQKIEPQGKDEQSKKQPKKFDQKSKYTPEKIKNMLTSYDKHFEERNDVKYAWNCVAEEHSIKSGKAAEMAVRRHQEKNK